MKREIEGSILPLWKNSKDRKPLLLRGARQVGKTYTLRSFGQGHFKNVVEINFELQPELKKIFQTLDPEEIIKNIRLSLNASIEPGETLLFLDEIQECPQAITSLRYFYENLPDLHVVGAGSLLEFSLGDRGFKMPVGRVQYLYLQPLSFEEFLTALNEEALKDFLHEVSIKKVVPEVIHEKFLKLFREYLRIGGMPAVVRTYLEDRAAIDYQNQQTLLLQTYRDDFGKYAASRSRQAQLQKVFLSAPSMVGKRYKYSHVDRDVQARDLKEALSLLNQAGVIYKVVSASAHGLPFQLNENKFKILFLDVGLMQRGCGLDAEIASAENFLAVNAGALAEQVVGQELLAYGNPHEDRRLFFWVRDKKNSQAEIDYLTTHQSHILPIEIKSGSTGTLKSLKLFMEEHKTKVGIRFSGHPLSFHEQILSIPLYAVSQMSRLVEEVM